LPIEALVTLKAGASPAIGRERVQLLETVAREGSITAGAKSFGLTYKAAWDALEAMEKVFGQPLLKTRTGGRSGGGATLTPMGARVIRAFHRLEAEMARAIRVIEPALAGGQIPSSSRASPPLMRTSARNALRGIISAIAPMGLKRTVALSFPEGATVRCIVTSASVRELGLRVGREAIALVKASLVDVAPEAAAADNSIRGVVRRCKISAVTAEVELDIGSGIRLTASIPAERARALGLRLGKPAYALFQAAHVVIAIE
jgi:molybdate transport system regulatory protein